VAIKTLKPGMMQPAEFLREAAIMKQLHHPKLVALYAVCSKDEPILIITELMNGGSLLHCLRNNGRRTITSDKLIDFAAQVRACVRACSALTHSLVTLASSLYLYVSSSLATCTHYMIPDLLSQTAHIWSTANRAIVYDACLDSKMRRLRRSILQQTSLSGTHGIANYCCSPLGLACRAQSTTS